MKKKIKKKEMPDPIPPRILKIFDPIFRQRIWVLLNHDDKSYARFLNRQKIKDISKEIGNFAGFTAVVECENGLHDYLILLKHFNWCIKDQGTLIHEITHAVIRIFEGNNIPFNSDTQEFIAHSITGLYETIAQKLLVLKK